MLTSDICAARLMPRLRLLGFNPSERQVEDVVVEDFNVGDFSIADGLLSAEVPEAPWRIRTGPAAGKLASRFDSGSCSFGFANTLALLLNGADEVRASVPRVTADASGVLLTDADGALIAALEPITMTAVPAELAARAAAALKGVGDFEYERLAKRISALPGLSAVRLPEYSESRRENIPGGGVMVGEPVLKTPSSWAAALRVSLERRCGATVKQSQAQDLLAAVLGASNWHHLVAAYNARQVAGQLHGLFDGDDATYYPDAAHALAAFSLLMQRAPEQYAAPTVNAHGLLSADDPAGTHDGASAWRLTVDGLDGDADSSAYLSAAAAIDALDWPDRAAAIASELGVGRSAVDRVPGILRRRPWAKAMTIRDWRFSVEKRGDFAYLRAERGLAGASTHDSGWVACYKANLLLAIDGIKLTADYGRKVSVFLPGFGETDQRALAAFSGIKQGIDHASYLRSI